MKMNSEFWDEKYRTRQTGWNAGAPTPPLTEFVDFIDDKSVKILIPGCGNAHEAEYLLDKGFTNVTILDFSRQVCNELEERFEGNNHIEVVCNDFFNHKGKYDFILEQTFFCALHPSQREAYVEKVAELLAPDGLIAGVLFNREFEQDGPPYGGSKEEYLQLFEPRLKIIKMEQCYNSIKPREGNELFFIAKRLGD